LSFIIVAQTWFFYGIAMEFVQEYLQNGRSYDVKDMIADGIGCGLALLASLPFIRRKQTADPL
jgi:VanZ family protein